MFMMVAVVAVVAVVKPRLVVRMVATVIVFFNKMSSSQDVALAYQQCLNLSNDYSNESIFLHLLVPPPTKGGQ